MFNRQCHHVLHQIIGRVVVAQMPQPITPYPGSHQASLAWGEKANCLLQWAQYSHQYEQSSNAFRQVIESPRADATARSIAEVGLGVVLEKVAEQKSGEEQITVQKLALNHYLDVFYKKVLRDNEEADLFWTKKAGLEAGRLAESLQEWLPAINVYRQLQELLPQLRESFEKRIFKCQENTKRI